MISVSGARWLTRCQVGKSKRRRRRRNPARLVSFRWLPCSAQSVERLPIARAAISFTPAGTDLAVGDLESGFKVVGSCGLNQELWSQPGTLAAGSWRIVNRPKLSPAPAAPQTHPGTKSLPGKSRPRNCSLQCQAQPSSTAVQSCRASSADCN